MVSLDHFMFAIDEIEFEIESPYDYTSTQSSEAKNSSSLINNEPDNYKKNFRSVNSQDVALTNDGETITSFSFGFYSGKTLIL